MVAPTVVRVGHVNNGGSARSVAVAGDYGFLANEHDGLRIYDVTDPARPLNCGHTNDTSTAKSVTVAGDFAYLASGMSGLWIYSITNACNPVVPVIQSPDLLTTSRE